MAASKSGSNSIVDEFAHASCDHQFARTITGADEDTCLRCGVAWQEVFVAKGRWTVADVSGAHGWP